MKFEVTLPIRVQVVDYHEFYDLRTAYRKLNPEIKVKEIAGEYEGIVYVGSLTDPENAKMVEAIKQDNA